jgi:cobalamin-dependent methionine synthase I
MCEEMAGGSGERVLSTLPGQSIDIGVMCSYEKNLEKAKEYKVDVIGLSL